MYAADKILVHLQNASKHPGERERDEGGGGWQHEPRCANNGQKEEWGETPARVPVGAGSLPEAIYSYSPLNPGSLRLVSGHAHVTFACVIKCRTTASETLHQPNYCYRGMTPPPCASPDRMHSALPVISYQSESASNTTITSKSENEEERTRMEGRTLINGTDGFIFGWLWNNNQH